MQIIQLDIMLQSKMDSHPDDFRWPLLSFDGLCVDMYGSLFTPDGPKQRQAHATGMPCIILFKQNLI